jgi:hypothetical protein
MVTFLFSILLFLALAGFAALLHAFSHVVDGYEDESGFHEGRELLPEGGSMAVRSSHGENVETQWAAGRLAQEHIAHHGHL